MWKLANSCLASEFSMSPSPVIIISMYICINSFQDLDFYDETRDLCRGEKWSSGNTFPPTCTARNINKLTATLCAAIAFRKQKMSCRRDQLSFIPKETPLSEAKLTIYHRRKVKVLVKPHPSWTSRNKQDTDVNTSQPRVTD